MLNKEIEVLEEDLLVYYGNAISIVLSNNEDNCSAFPDFKEVMTSSINWPLLNDDNIMKPVRIIINFFIIITFKTHPIQCLELVYDM
jgi:hypothetical protein